MVDGRRGYVVDGRRETGRKLLDQLSQQASIVR